MDGSLIKKSAQNRLLRTLTLTFLVGWLLIGKKTLTGQNRDSRKLYTFLRVLLRIMLSQELREKLVSVMKDDPKEA